MTWLDEAACRGTATEVFYEAQHFEEAKRLCSVCPWQVKEECLSEAMAEEAALRQGRWGIRGGLTEEERALLHRRMVRRARTAAA